MRAVSAPRCAVQTLVVLALLGGRAAAADPPAVDLETLARSQANVHRFSTLFTAQKVRDHLADEQGLAADAAAAGSWMGTSSPSRRAAGRCG